MKILKKSLQGILFLFVFLCFVVVTGLWENIGQQIFNILMLIILSYSSYEIILALFEAGYSPFILPVCLVVAASYPLIIFWGYLGIIGVIGFGFTVIFCYFVFGKSKQIKDLFATLFVLFYPVFFLGIAILIINNYGMLPLLVAIGSAMMADTFAYFFGSLIKGPKPFPTISPNKTISGCLFGLLGGAVGAIVSYSLLVLSNIPVNIKVNFTDISNLSPWVVYSIIGFVIAIFAEIGDLAASKVKRAVGIKDFGKIMGDHGGIIDRLDSMIFSIIFMIIFILAVYGV